VKWWMALPVVPLLLGLMLFVVLVSGLAPNPTLYLRADVGTLALLVGFGLTLYTGTNAAIWVWSQTATRRRVEHEARIEAAEERRRFLRRLDHEVKNPLTAIRAGLANLSVSDNAAGETLTSIEAQVLRLSRLLSELRKLAEFETQPIERTIVDLGGLLEEVLGVVEERPEAASRHITLTVPQAPWPLPDIYADWDLLFLAVHNLLDNAVKYTLPGNTIELRAFEDGATVVIEVADTGPGIPEAELPHVWEELSRGYSARGVPGSGLGLSLVRTITERHGGRVTLRSRAGHGTVFSMRLPVGRG
jgi:two-component system OmpR family sensor kinase